MPKEAAETDIDHAIIITYDIENGVTWPLALRIKTASKPHRVAEARYDAGRPSESVARVGRAA